MIMTTKAAQLKQTLCFRSLRLMDKDYLNTDSKSFSDSEIEERNHSKENISKELKRSSSENCLLLHIKENESDSIKPSSSINENDKTNKKSSRSLNSDFSKTLNISQIIIGKSAYVSNKETSYEFKQLKSEELNSIKNQSDTVPEMANPYKVLENSNTSEITNENLLGEPRCLALKKYSGDFNPFLTDDSLVFEPDFEAENFGTEEKFIRNKKQDVSRNPQIKDMFVDDEEAVLGAKKSSTLDREEGELTPERHQAVLDPNNVDNASAKLNTEFFQKINECLLDLDGKCREFYSSSTPEGAMKYLQRTLSNVDSIKRKLTFLISSKNSESEKKKKLRKIVEKYYVSKSTSAKESERNSVPRHSRSNRKSSEDKSGTHSSRPGDHKNEDKGSNDVSTRDKDKELSHRSEDSGRNLVESSHEKKVESSSKYSHRKRNSQDKPTQAYLHNRKKIDILEKLGTKKEIQRIKSLFERQMSLITKHVIQEKTSNKDRNAEKYRRRHNSQKEIDKSRVVRGKINLNELETLEDMEDFLNTLKNKTSDKVLSEQFIRNERKKKLLMFTSKRVKSAGLSHRSDKIVPLAPALEPVSTSKTVMEESASKREKNAGLSHRSDKIVPLAPALEPASNSKTEMEYSAINKNGLAVPANQNRVSDSNELKEKVAGTEATSKDISTKETQDASGKIKEICSVEHSTPLLTKKKASEQLKTDSDKGHAREFNRVHSLEDVVASNQDKSSFTAKETEVNSAKESHHKIRNIPDMDQKKSVKRIREEGSEHEIESEKQSLKRKRSSDDQTLTKKSINNDTNLDMEKTLELDSEKLADESGNSLIRDLLTKKIFILDDNNLASNNQFCLKVINNEVYLKKISSRHKHKRSTKKSKHHETKKVEETIVDDQRPQQNNSERQLDVIDTTNSNLEDMENFLQELRSKKKVSDDDDKKEVTRSNPLCKELKFLAKIRAKRKAKLMACVSDGANAIEKEAKFLKSLEKREGDLSDTPDIESRKQKLMEKMRAEVDAIVFAEKPSVKMSDDDPLKDVKNFLNMIKEVESVDDESSKQVYVSFPLKRSDVKRLESLTSGKPSSLTEESQKFLNSVRAKMRAKKTSVSNISSLMQKPED